MLLRFVELLGVQLDMDYDDEVTITVPEVVSRAEIEHALKPFGEVLREQVRFRAKRQRSVFVGGQLNGQEVLDRTLGVRSGYGHLTASGRYAYWIRHRIERGRWEMYEQVLLDGRAFFRGYATSERKARHGEITEQASR